MTKVKELAAAEKSLRRRFRAVETSIRIGDRQLSILHPESAEDLIDERDFDRDERLPYWAELWPSSRALAEHLLERKGRGRSLLELGCGSGLVATCAALAGFVVTASDYYEDALRFARVNAWRNDAPVPTTVLLDWRAMPDDLPRFDHVVASDVLYEREYGELVATAFATTLAPRGTGWLADPGRVGREQFISNVEAAGLEIRSRRDVPFEEGEIRQTITMFEVRWPSV
jgi:ETFB lysine methyltransferase